MQKQSAQALGIVVAFALLGLLLNGNAPLGRLVWPAGELPEPPSQGQLAAFLAYGLVQAAAFGLGIAVLLFGIPVVRRAAAAGVRWAWPAFAGAVWVLVSWVPHDNLHMHFGENVNALIALEWGFHATLIASGLAMVPFFFESLERAGVRTRAAPPAKVAQVVRR